MADTPFALDLAPRGRMSIDCMVNGPIETNTYFAVSGDEAVIIDPAWDGAELARQFALRHPGVTVRALVCTHGHADHVGGVAGLRRVLGADVPYLISRRDASFVPGALEHMRANWGFEMEDPGEPTRLLDEGDEISFGDVRLQVFDVPGHTPGGVVLFAATEEGNLAFVGDTLFPGRHGRTDLEGGSEAEIIGSLGKMARLMPDDTLCLIGHDETTTIGAERSSNPFMARGLRRR
ncbi:MAG: MBL fold metallo-hydrolase [Coriobacteriaceae bacterium]|nr:MBL fold metallo-hydrolase [Coriobacteriaceae bacterium]